MLYDSSPDIAAKERLVSKANAVFHGVERYDVYNRIMLRSYFSRAPPTSVYHE